MKLIFSILAIFIFACGSGPQQVEKRNAELIVTYQGKEVHRAGSRYKSFDELKEISERVQKKYIIFSARWCKSCTFLNKALEQSGHAPLVSQIDVEELWVQGLAKFFKITGVPTLLVVDEKDRIIKRSAGPSEIVMYLLINVKTEDEGIIP